jgi:hypothetical protein
MYNYITVYYMFRHRGTITPEVYRSFIPTSECTLLSMLVDVLIINFRCEHSFITSSLELLQQINNEIGNRTTDALNL